MSKHIEILEAIVTDKTIVSLKTETYKKGKSYVCAKVLTTLKRKSKGHDLLNDEIQYEIEDLSLIENLQRLPDGEYELVYSGISEDWETGHYEPTGYRLCTSGEDT